MIVSIDYQDRITLVRVTNIYMHTGDFAEPPSLSYDIEEIDDSNIHEDEIEELVSEAVRCRLLEGVRANQ